MNLKKQIQVALNSCEPNVDRVKKIEEISNNYAIEVMEWYRLKCIVSNFDMYMSAAKALRMYKQEKNF